MSEITVEEDIRKHPRLNFWSNQKGEIFNKDGTKRNINSWGRYIRVNVVDNGVARTLSVHRLTYETWKGEIPEGLVINHIDGDRYNNAIDNLEVCTIRENTIHAYRTGLAAGIKGEDNSSAILNNNQVIEIYNLIKNLYNNEEIAQKMGILFRHVSLLRNGSRWKHLFKEHFTEPIPALGGSIGRDRTLKMLYKSYFTEETNAEIARQTGFDPSNISKIRHGATYLWSLKNKELIKKLYEAENNI